MIDIREELSRLYWDSAGRVVPPEQRYAILNIIALQNMTEELDGIRQALLLKNRDGNYRGKSVSVKFGGN